MICIKILVLVTLKMPPKQRISRRRFGNRNNISSMHRSKLYFFSSPAVKNPRPFVSSTIKPHKSKKVQVAEVPTNLKAKIEHVRSKTIFGCSSVDSANWSFDVNSRKILSRSLGNSLKPTTLLRQNFSASLVVVVW